MDISIPLLRNEYGGTPIITSGGASEQCTSAMEGKTMTR